MSDKMLQYIHDYLDGEISSEDSQRLEEWLQESRENVRSFRNGFAHSSSAARPYNWRRGSSIANSAQRKTARPTNREPLHALHFSYRRFARPGQHQCCLLLPTDFPTGPTAKLKRINMHN